MPKKWTHAASFAHFGTVPGNPRWSWSARSPDGKTVALTIWQDEMRIVDGKTVYESNPRRAIQAWMKRPGNRERLENLKWARDHCEGLFRVVIARAEDAAADPRRIAECFPHPKLVMRLTHLNEETGEFRAESIQQT